MFRKLIGNCLGTFRLQKSSKELALVLRVVNIKEELNMMAVLLQCTRSIFSSSVRSTDFGFDDKLFVRTHFQKTLMQQVLMYPLVISYQVYSVQ